MWGRNRADPEAVAAARARLASIGVRQPRTAEPEQETQEAPLPPSDDDDSSPGPFGFAMDRAAMDPTGRSGRHAAASPLQRVAGHLFAYLPMPVRGRLGVTSQHVSVVAVVLAVSLAAGSWLFLRSRPAPVSDVPRAPVVARSVATVAGTPSSSTAIVPATSTQPTPSVVIVDVAGKVRNPGIVELPLGSRVVDALKAAGGARPEVNLSTLNLARLLVDGEQILVGVAGASGAPPISTPGTTVVATPGMVNINTATQAQLEELPGVGPVTALAILTWRDENGSFSSVDELLEVSGIGDATLEDLRPYVTV